MALKPQSGLEADTAGNPETLSLFAPTATISSAFYGTSSSMKPVTVAKDAKSLSFTVLKGPNILTVNLIAPQAKTETAVLYQGTEIIATVTVTNQVGIAAIGIQGN